MGSSELASNENDCKITEEKGQSGERSLLLHGLESDWVEEEMMQEDEEFIRDVIEQKVRKSLLKAGVKKKIQLLDVYRWTEGPHHRSMPPVVIIFKLR